MEQKKIAIFTGASSGMGQEFVKQLDAKYSFDEIWLIARRVERLEALKKELKNPVVILPLDLSSLDSIDILKEKLASEKPIIQLAVNAAGFGKFAAFQQTPLQDQLSMVDLNSRWTVAFTYLILPYMTKGSEFYQMGSISAFQPVPYISVYAASKAFVVSFIRAVNRENKPKGIKMMAVCPFWVKTEFFDHAVSDDTISYYSIYYEAKDVVSRAIKDMRKGKDISVCGKYARAQARLVKILPHRLVMNTWCKQQKKP